MSTSTGWLEQERSESREKLTERLKQVLLDRAEGAGLTGLKFVPAESDREGWLAVIRQKKVGFASQELFGENFKVEAVSREGKPGGYLLSGMVVRGKSMVMLLSEPDRLGVVGGPMPLFIPDEAVWMGTELVKTLVDLKAREIVSYLAQAEPAGEAASKVSMSSEVEPIQMPPELKFTPRERVETKEALLLGVQAFIKEGWKGKFAWGGEYQHREWQSRVLWLTSGNRRAGEALVQVRELDHEANEVTRMFLREADLTEKGLGQFTLSAALVCPVKDGKLEPERVEFMVRSADEEEWHAKAVWLSEDKEEVRQGRRNQRAQKIFRGVFGEERLSFAEAVERLRK